MNKKNIIVGSILVVVIAICTIVFLLFGKSITDKGAIADTNTSTQTPRPSDAAEIKIIAFGDSLTAGFGVIQSEAYPAQLEVALRTQGYNISVINSGVSGETTRGNLERANFIQNQNADIILLGIGGNDALRSLPANETEKNMRATIDILEASIEPPIILLLEMQAPLNAGIEYKRDFDAIYPKIAKEKGLILIPFITTDIFTDQKNKLADGIHYNAIGYKKVIDMQIIPALREILKGPNATPLE